MNNTLAALNAVKLTHKINHHTLHVSKELFLALPKAGPLETELPWGQTTDSDDPKLKKSFHPPGFQSHPYY